MHLNSQANNRFMEAFEHVAKVFLESKGYAVSSNVKFPVRRRTKKQAYEEYQEHGYEVDLVAARHDELLLGSVKSFLGSYGLSRQFFRDICTSASNQWNKNKLFTEPEIREGVLAEASRRYGYPINRIFLGLFVGKFKSGDEADICAHVSQMRCGGGAVRLFKLRTILAGVVTEAKRKTYHDDPVIVALKCLHEVDWITSDYQSQPDGPLLTTNT